MQVSTFTQETHRGRGGTERIFGTAYQRCVPLRCTYPTKAPTHPPPSSFRPVIYTRHGEKAVGVGFYRGLAVEG